MSVLAFEKRLRKLEASSDFDPFSDLSRLSDDELQALIEVNRQALLAIYAESGGYESHLAKLRALADADPSWRGEYEACRDYGNPGEC